MALCGEPLGRDRVAARGVQRSDHAGAVGQAQDVVDLLGQPQRHLCMPIGIAGTALRPAHPCKIAVRENPRVVAIEPDVELMVLRVVERQRALQILGSFRELAEPEQRPAQAPARIEKPVGFLRAVAGERDQLLAELTGGTQMAVHVVVRLAGRAVRRAEAPHPRGRRRAPSPARTPRRPPAPRSPGWPAGRPPGRSADGLPACAAACAAGSFATRSNPAAQMRDGLQRGGALDRPQPCAEPGFDRLVVQARMGQMQGEQFGILFDGRREVGAQRPAIAAMQLVPATAQHAVVSCVTDQGVLEGVGDRRSARVDGRSGRHRSGGRARPEAVGA